MFSNLVDDPEKFKEILNKSVSFSAVVSQTLRNGLKK